MANGKLEFAVALKLITQNFEKGLSVFKRGIHQMRTHTLAMVSAFGAGTIGLSNLISSFKDAARETSKAQTALKNVSKSGKEFAEELSFVRNLAKEYGQGINEITSSYASFKAAADVSGLAVEKQRKVFEAMTRATIAFGLGTYESSLSFKALQQMMSKGKISSEELRRQMGEHIPLAMEAMARAAGVSMEGLDAALKKGEILSKDVLPKFADELNKMLPSVDTDNLETSFSRLRNKIVEIVEDNGIIQKIKRIIDTTTQLVGFLADNIGSIFTALISLRLGSLLSGLFASIKKEHEDEIKLLEARYQKSVDIQRHNVRKVREAREQHLSLERKKSDELLKIENKHRASIEMEDKKLFDIRKKQADKEVRLREATRETDRRKLTRSLEDLKQAEETALAQRANNEVRYNSDRLIAIDKVNSKYKQSISQAKAEVEVRRNAQRAELEEARKISNELLEKRNQEVTLWGVATKQISAMWKGVKVAIQSAFRAMVWGAIIDLISTIVMKVAGWIKEQARLNDLLNHSAEAIEKAGELTDNESVKMRTILSHLEENIQARKRDNSLIDSANSLLGTQISQESQLVSILRQKLRLKGDEKKLEEALKRRAELDEEEKKAVSGANLRGVPGRNIDEALSHENAYSRSKYTQYATITSNNYGSLDNGFDFSHLKRIKKAGEELDRTIAALSGNIESTKKNIDYTVRKSKFLADVEDVKNLAGVPKSKKKEKITELSYLFLYDLGVKPKDVNDKRLSGYGSFYTDKKKSELNISTSGGKNRGSSESSGYTHIDPIKQSEDEFYRGIREFTNQLSAGVITQKEYQESVSDLSDRTRKEISAHLGESAAGNSVFVQAQKYLLSEGKGAREYDTRRSELDKELAIALQKHQDGLFSLEAYNEERRRLIGGFIVGSYDIPDLTDEEKNNRTLLGNVYAQIPTSGSRKERDTTFDYRLDDLGRKKAELDAITDEIERLQGLLDDSVIPLKEISDELARLKAEASTMEQAIRISEIQDDIKELQNEIRDGFIDGVTNSIGALSGLYGSVKEVMSLFSDEEKDPFEKMLKTLSGIVSIIEQVMGLVGVFEKIAKATDAATMAQNALSVATIANNAATTSSEAAASATRAAIQKKELSNTKKAILAQLLKKYIAIPAGGEALAMAQYLMINGMIESAGAFKDGGLISYGSYTGDKTLAFVNRGERVVNAEQQRWLENLSNGWLFGRSDNISLSGEFRLRDRDLVAIIDKYNRRKSR